MSFGADDLRTGDYPRITSTRLSLSFQSLCFRSESPRLNSIAQRASQMEISNLREELPRWPSSSKKAAKLVEQACWVVAAELERGAARCLTRLLRCIVYPALLRQSW